MAESLSHKFGQLIGDLLELAIEPHLEKFARKHKLFLDRKGVRAARSGKKLSWIDGKANSHDLDFVLERDGTDEKLGTPVAFIETAWRRYTKHSRNKAQEIQGAILPLAEKYKNSSPFIGVVLAGEFTGGALDQLRSVGFCVLYFSYNSVVASFDKFGIDARFDESTPESEFKKKIKAIEGLPPEKRGEISKELLMSNKKDVAGFLNSLSESISRYIESVVILPLHGSESMLPTVGDAINFLHQYEESSSGTPFCKYEIIIKYNSGDKIDALFKIKKDAIKFLEAYL